VILAERSSAKITQTIIEPNFTEGTMAKDKDSQTPSTETIAETDNYLAWRAEEPDGETTYHLELNNVTLHFFTEEWEEFLDLVKNLA
jgi:hypothetical protein